MTDLMDPLLEEFAELERQVERRKWAAWMDRCPHPFDERVPVNTLATGNLLMICLLCGKVMPTTGDR